MIRNESFQVKRMMSFKNNAGFQRNRSRTTRFLIGFNNHIIISYGIASGWGLLSLTKHHHGYFDPK